MTGRFLALGDSYTIGEGVEPSDRWPIQLVRALRNEGISLQEPRIIAKTGWTTSDLLAAIEGATPALDHDFDLVSLLAGVNDQYRGLGVRSFKAGFERLLSRAIELAGGAVARVVVVSIPDWSVTPFAASDPRGRSAIATEIAEFNRVARDLVGRNRAAFIDVTADSQRAGVDESLLAGDALHPSAAMYASWVKLILPAVTRAHANR